MLRFVDGFDYYPTADIVKKWGAISGDVLSSYPSIQAQGRYGSGTGAMQLGTSGTAGVVKVFPGQTNYIIGFAMKTDTGLNPGQFITIFSSAGLTQCYLSLNSGVITYVNGARNTVSLSSSTAIIPNVWYYIEFKTTFSASCAAHSTQVRINGAVVIDVPAGTNTIGDSINNVVAAPTLRVFASGGVFTTNTTYIDDFYVADSSGSVNNDFLGDIRIETIYPSGAGSSTQFTANTGTNWAAVSEIPEDGDTTYVGSNVPGQKDIYTVTDLSSVPTVVHGIQISTIGRKDDAGSRLVSPIVKSGGVEYDHSATNPFGLADQYTQHLDVWEQDPNGTIPWTGASINALNLGVKVVG